MLYFIARLTASLAINQQHIVCRVVFINAVNYGKAKGKKRLNSAQMSSTPLPFQQVALFIQLIPYAVIVAACISTEWSLVFW